MHHVPPLLVGPLAAVHRDDLRIEIPARRGRPAPAPLHHQARSRLVGVARAAGLTGRRPTRRPNGRPTTAAVG